MQRTRNEANLNTSRYGYIAKQVKEKPREQKYASKLQQQKNDVFVVLLFCNPDFHDFAIG